MHSVALQQPAAVGSSALHLQGSYVRGRHLPVQAVDVNVLWHGHLPIGQGLEQAGLAASIGPYEAVPPASAACQSASIAEEACRLARVRLHNACSVSAHPGMQPAACTPAVIELQVAVLQELEAVEEEGEVLDLDVARLRVGGEHPGAGPV